MFTKITYFKHDCKKFPNFLSLITFRGSTLFSNVISDVRVTQQNFVSQEAFFSVTYKLENYVFNLNGCELILTLNNGETLIVRKSTKETYEL